MTEIIKDIVFEDNTDRQHGRYDFSFTMYDDKGAQIMDYDGYIIQAPTLSRRSDEIEWGQNVPNEWETAENFILTQFHDFIYKRITNQI